VRIKRGFLAGTLRGVPRPKSEKVFLGVNVDPREFAALQRLARRMNVPMTELVRAWLRSLDTYSEAPVRPPKKER
jgi:hypothetical protein